MADAERPFDIRHNLGPILDDLKEISPKLATGTRRELRGVGQSVITAQQAILRGEPVGGVVSKTTYSIPRVSRRGGYRRGPRARELGGARIVSVESQASARQRSRGLRASVAASLKTAVRTPRTGRGASVRVQSSRPYWANKALNAKKWRHPVFGGSAWIEQAGNQYFTRGAAIGASEAQEALYRVVDEAMRTIKSHHPIT